jgi:hypothetical protein
VAAADLGGWVALIPFFAEGRRSSHSWPFGMSCLVSSFHVLSCLVLSCRVLSCLAGLTHVFSCLAGLLVADRSSAVIHRLSFSFDALGGAVVTQQLLLSHVGSVSYWCRV